MPSTISMKKLLETGVHFGHRTTKWNPRMEEFIFDARNGIHIIDLRKTFANLNAYYDIVRDTIANGGIVLFVGTKRQAQESIQREAARCGMPYVNTRWLGGTLTNWRTIRGRIDQLKKLEKSQEAGEFSRLTKKEALMKEREIEKLRIRLGGLRDLRKLPDLIVVVDTERELTAVKEDMCRRMSRLCQKGHGQISADGGGYDQSQAGDAHGMKEQHGGMGRIAIGFKQHSTTPRSM